MPLSIKNKFNLFQEVYVASDTDQNLHQVVQINVLPGNMLMYLLRCDGDTSEHYEEEILKDKRVF